MQARPSEERAGTVDGAARVRQAPVAGQARRGLGRRLLLMVGAFVGYSLAELAAKAVLLLQLLFTVCAGRHSDRLLVAGGQISRYIHLCWRYLLFCDQSPPWPLDRFGHR